MATAILQSTPDETTEHAGNQNSRRFSRRSLLVMVAVAWLLRMIVVALIFRDLPDPARHYERFGNEVGWIARSLTLHQGFSSPFFTLSGPTALLPPLYPYLLAAIFKVFGIYSVKSALTILTLNSTFSALTCLPLFLAAKLSFNTRVAWFAGWGWAIYPFSIYFSAGRVWEFSLTALLLTTCFWLSLRLHKQRPVRWLVFGLLYGLTGLSNPAVFSLFPILLLLPLWRFWRLRRGHDSRFLPGLFSLDLLRSGAMLGVGMFIVLTPWTVRNYKVMHVLCPVRDCFWYEFWSANNGDSSNPTLSWTHPASNPVEMDEYKSLGEIAYIEHKHTVVIDYVKQHPGFFVHLTLRRIVNYWTGFWSLEPSYMQQEPTQLPNVFFCTSLTLLMLIGGYSWWRKNSADALPYLLAIAIFPFAYYVSHPLMDYRQPIEPEIVVLVVVGLHAVKARIKSRRANAVVRREGDPDSLMTPSFGAIESSVDFAASVASEKASSTAV